MTDHNPLPRCPYCGGEMEIEIFENYLGWCGQAVCKKCKSRAALKRHYALQAEAEQAAYEAAMQRWQEPNRVLTLDEVREYCKQGADAAPLWVEFQRIPSVSRWLVICSPEFMCNNNDTVRNYCIGFDYKYNETWRCWLRKPTEEEMATTP